MCLPNNYAVSKIAGEHVDHAIRHDLIWGQYWNISGFDSIVRGYYLPKHCLLCSDTNCNVLPFPLWSFDSWFNQILFWDLMSISSTALPPCRLQWGPPCLLGPTRPVVCSQGYSFQQKGTQRCCTDQHGSGWSFTRLPFAPSLPLPR